jgi:arylsulfatase
VEEEHEDGNTLSNPAKLRELQELFLVEAAKYQVLPLDNTKVSRMVMPKPSLVAGRDVFTYSGEVTGIPRGDAPGIIAKSFSISSELEIPQGGAEGMLNTNGRRFGGYGFYLLKGHPVFVFNLLDLERVRWEGKDALTPGKHTVEFDFNYEGAGVAAGSSGLGKGGLGVLKVDGKEVARTEIARTVPFIFQWDETFDVGADTGTPVDDNDYQVPFRFTGKLLKTTVKLEPPKPGCR